MTKQELKKAIENGESVWVINNVIFEIELNEETCAVKDNILIKNYSHPEFYKPQQICSIEYCFSTKAEAEHYLHHANVSRSEQLPFLTWEEFLKEQKMWFIDNKGIDYVLLIVENKIEIRIFLGVYKTWDLTEANFYKAYDECVRLFKGGGDDETYSNVFVRKG